MMALLQYDGVGLGPKSEPWMGVSLALAVLGVLLFVPRVIRWWRNRRSGR